MTGIKTMRTSAKDPQNTDSCKVPTESGCKEPVRDHLSRITQALFGSPAVSYILDSRQLRLMYCNPAWDRFAKANGAPQLTSGSVIGSDLFDAIPSVLRSAYSKAFQQVLSTGQVWEQSYECSSPTLFRKFRMRIHLLKPQNWFLVTNALIFERPHTRTTELDSNAYVDANGLITTCAHCRCSRRVDSSNQWDFVSEHLRVKSSVKVSHVLCPVCRVYFYPLY
jgi:hypothetical protein